jgi:hypothetical protein
VGVYAGGVVTVSDCRITDKQYGLYVGDAGLLRLSGTVVTNNGTGVFTLFGGVTETYGTNQIRGNNTDINGAFAPVSLK